jgi:dihydroorotate dehydrogenase (NAD+) catalytic subunit
MLNAIGLANPGLDSFVKTTLPMLSALPTVVIGSVAGHSVADYVAVAQEFDGHDALPLVELNVSCPNTDTGRQFGDDPELLTDLVTKTRAVLKTTPMIVKLSPGSMNMFDLAEAAVHAGADALCLGNTMPAMAVDPETGSSRIGRASGGLSGPAIHPMVSKIIYDVSAALKHKDLNIPLIATGGVTHWEDAAEFIILGAHAVGMGTILMADPVAPRRILKGLDGWIRRKGGDLNSLRGSYTA